LPESGPTEKENRKATAIAKLKDTWGHPKQLEFFTLVDNKKKLYQVYRKTTYTT